MSVIKNVLASRYASEAMKAIFSDEGKILTEREFWIAVMKAQKKLGVDIPDKAITAYEKVKNEIDLEKIEARDRILRHDVKARIEIFCELAGYEHIHKGMTSRDLTENVEQYQLFKALRLVRLKTVRCLELLAGRAREYRDLVITARTHNVAAQPSTLGKRIAMAGQEILIALENLDYTISHYALRGLKGAVGTLLDQKTLLAGDREKVLEMENSVCEYLGFAKMLNAVGQVYPRSMDYEIIASLVQIGAGPSSFCKTLRLMAGHELFSEGFRKGQVGSSAMPHKMNSRNSERVNGFETILKGYATMAMGLSGDQWNEGDVSCSVVRRVALPDSFYAVDGLLETFMTVLTEMGAFEAVIAAELDRYLPFLASTTIMMEAVKAGIGRETAHEIIKKHAVAAVLDLREGKTAVNDFLDRLAGDSEFPLDRTQLGKIVANPADFSGMACEQVDLFIQQVKAWSDRFPGAHAVTPGQII
ncbi:MAG: adenylosuccinate lyase [Spirochaetales bacterium]|nr:adenylosuccinate lyase [Spirochaetales bacterium]